MPLGVLGDRLAQAGPPQVMAYWLMSSSMAPQASALIAASQGKSGKPWARFTAPYFRARPSAADHALGEVPEAPGLGGGQGADGDTRGLAFPGRIPGLRALVLEAADFTLEADLRGGGIGGNLAIASRSRIPSKRSN